MLFRKFIAAGLAHNSYLLGSRGVAAVVDPRRDCRVYLETASRHQMRITHIFETHRNEDYVIGSLELADLTGAVIYHGARMIFSYGSGVREGDRFTLGDLGITVLETPGHTDESISLLVRDNLVSGEPYMVFTGDALFSGDVGRTDLLGVGRRTEAASALYESIHKKILPLPDGVVVCPAHGAGSVCGTEIADHEFSTVGYEKATNPLLPLGKDEFVQRKNAELLYVPPYFTMMERLNKEGAPVIRRLPALRPYNNAALKAAQSAGAQVVDVRAPTSYAAGHLQNSLSIWREGLPAFIGWFLNYEDPILLVDDFNLGLDAIVPHFVRLGYDNIAGFLAGGFPAWFKGAEEIAQFPSWSVQELFERRNDPGLYLLDVRDSHNREKVGHIPGSIHIFVGELPKRIAEVPSDRPVVAYCDAGYKGCLACSILENAGYSRVTNLLGGMTAWVKAGYPVAR
jgi:hydroxyacylglutathione hydrolase